MLIAGMLLIDLAWGYHASSSIYRHKIVPVHSVRGEVMRGFARPIGISKPAPLIADLVRSIDANIPNDATLTVLPEGITINYLVRRKTPFPVQVLMPTVINRIGEGRLIAMLEMASPDYILMLPKPSAEYGVGLFGHDPRNGQAIVEWIRQHYALVWMEGEEYGQPAPLRSVLLRRIKADEPQLEEQ